MFYSKLLAKVPEEHFAYEYYSYFQNVTIAYEIREKRQGKKPFVISKI